MKERIKKEKKNEKKKKKKNQIQVIQKFLNKDIFAGNKGSKMDPDPKTVEGFDAFMEKYVRGLDALRASLKM